MKRELQQNSAAVRFDFIWKCPTTSLDMEAAEVFAVFIEKKKSLVMEGDFLLINLEKVKFVTLLGIISLTSIISRAVAYGFTITVSLPSHDPAKVFIHYFGLVDILDIPRQIDAVTIPGKISLKNPSHGKKVFSSKPIYSFHDADQFVNFYQIKEWINQLDPEIRETDFFRTGKFARVVSAELGLNIVTHAQLPTSPREGRESFGVVAMRVIKEDQRDSTNWILKTFPKQKAFVSRHIKTGFVEVCICDPGQGIRNALESSYKARMIESGLQDSIPGDALKLTRHVIEYAFDEFGTSKTQNDQWVTDAHALSRILSLVNVYNGILEITTSNVRVVYRLDENNLIKNESILGYKSHEATRSICPFGTYIRILLPLVLSAKSAATETTISILDGGPEPSIVALAAEYTVQDLADVSSFVTRTDSIGSFILNVSPTGTLVLDFSNCQHWRSDHFATLIDRLWNILSARFTVIVGIDSALAADVSARCFVSSERTEQFYHDQLPAEEREQIHYLSCLTDLHQVVPAIDVEGTLYWFGCPNPIASHICNKLLDSPMAEEDINSEIVSLGGLSSSVFPVLKCGSHIFKKTKNSNDKPVWKAALNVRSLEMLRGKVLVAHLDRHLQNVSEALWGRGGESAFLLPHSKKYVGMFIEATRLLQEEEFSREVGEVLARLVWTSLGKCDPTVIIATTAPSLLLSNSIRRWFRKLPLIVDIGHFFDSPKKVVLECLSTNEDTNNTNKVVVVQDIIHSGQTLSEICEALEAYGSTVDAVVTLIEFSNDITAISPGGVSKVAINGAEKTLISLYRYPRPHHLTAAELRKCKEEDVYWIEPYSLHPFKLSELRKAGYQYLRGSSPTVASGSHVEKLKELEENDMLRFGHFV